MTTGRIGKLAVRSIAVGWLAAAAVPATSIVVAQLTSFGRNASVDFYSTVAQVIPVFLIALVVEINVKYGRIAAYAESHEAQERAQHPAS